MLAILVEVATTATTNVVVDVEGTTEDAENVVDVVGPADVENLEDVEFITVDGNVVDTVNDAEVEDVSVATVTEVVELVVAVNVEDDEVLGGDVIDVKVVVVSGTVDVATAEFDVVSVEEARGDVVMEYVEAVDVGGTLAVAIEEDNVEDVEGVMMGVTELVLEVSVELFD